MTALKDYLTTRRSTPFPLFTERGPSEDELAQMLKLAARVPDHGKLAPWRFIIIPRMRGAALGAFLEGLVRADQPQADAARLEAERIRFDRAPVCVAVVSRAGPHVKIPVWEQELSAGATCLNLLHAAAAFGYGGVWVTEWIAFDLRVAAHFGLAETERFAGFVHIGAASGKADDRDRPDMAAITSVYGG